MRPGNRLVILLGCLLMLAGCASVPRTSDPIVIGTPAPGVDRGSAGLGIQPGGPEPDAPADAIVRGFIKSLTATDTGYSVAREFLTPQQASSWTPTEQVTIIDVAYAATPASTEGRVVLNANRVAQVDTAGTYYVDNSGLEYEFDLVQIQGQWRISNPPQNLILDTRSFESLYTAASVYFSDPSGTRLVPDVRYFRNNPEQRANRLVQALLNGPVSALEPGVRNEFDEPVTLRSAVAFGTSPITIDLGGMGQKSEAELRVASAQLMWTLRDLGVTSLRITNEGVPIEIAGIEPVQSRHDWDDFDPNAFPVNASAHYIRSGAVFADTTAPVPGPVGAGEYAITEAAISIGSDDPQIAAVSGAATPPVLRAGSLNGTLGVVDIPGTTSLSSPTWGPSSDEFWIVRNGSELVRVSTTGSPKIVGTPALSQLGPIRSIALSRDGTRLAFVAGEPEDAGRLYLATVESTADSVAISQPMPVVTDVDVTAVAWSDARTIAFLGKPASSSNVFPYTMLVDGSQRRAMPQPMLSGQAQTLAAAPERPLLISISENVLKLENSEWVSLVGGIVVNGVNPFYPG